MEEGSETWETTVLHRIEGMQAVHRQQRRRLESDIESTMFQASYSRHLVGIMQREEEVLAQGGDTTTLASRVEAMLAAETKRLFELQAQRRNERWRALFELQGGYRERFSRQIREESARREAVEEGAQHRQKHQQHQVEQVEQQRSCRPLRGYDFKAREAAMRAANAANWAENERFNMQNAFGLQLKRLEVDWAAHEDKVGADYNARRATLEARLDANGGVLETGGKARSRAPRSPGNSGGDGDLDDAAGGGRSTPWRNREKQSRLIHTAPVFQPDTGRALPPGRAAGWNARGVRGGAGVAGSARGRQNAAEYWARVTEKELEKLEEAFAAVGRHVRVQKVAAQRWIRRQRVRMEAQIEAVAEERAKRVQYQAEADKGEADILAMVASSTKTRAPVASTL